MNESKMNRIYKSITISDDKFDIEDILDDVILDAVDEDPWDAACRLLYQHDSTLLADEVGEHIEKWNTRKHKKKR